MKLPGESGRVLSGALRSAALRARGLEVVSMLSASCGEVLGVELAMYGVGFALAAMICGALAGSFAAEHGWARVVPIAVVATIVLGVVLGWAINGWIVYSQASAYH
jgi:hypothetical protein